MGRSALVLVLAASAGIASADVTFYDMFKTGAFTQTSDSQPVTPDYWFGTARIFTNTAGEASSGTLTFPDSTTQPLTAASTTEIGYYPGSVSSLADLDAMFPTGTYTYSIDSGTLAGQTGSLVEESADFADSVPYLTGGSYSALQNANAYAPVSVTWNAFGHAGGANTEVVFFTVYDNTTATTVLDNSGLEGSYNGDTLTAGMLQPGHNYTYTLYFSSRYELSGQGFGGATSESAFDYATSGSFTAVPEPSSLLALSGALVLLKRKRLRR